MGGEGAGGVGWAVRSAIVVAMAEQVWGQTAYRWHPLRRRGAGREGGGVRQSELIVDNSRPACAGEGGTCVPNFKLHLGEARLATTAAYPFDGYAAANRVESRTTREYIDDIGAAARVRVAWRACSAANLVEVDAVVLPVRGPRRARRSSGSRGGSKRRGERVRYIYARVQWVHIDGGSRWTARPCREPTPKLPVQARGGLDRIVRVVRRREEHV